jgi:urea carboxylase-associated protein 1
MALIESTLNATAAIVNEVCLAGEPWIKTIRRGQIFRILDLEGNQAVDTLFYSATDPEERYSATDTIVHQGALYLTAGSVLYSNEGNPMLTIVADTCGRHDTLGGACAAESNTVRYALDKLHMHSCRDNFLGGLAHCDCHDASAAKLGLGKRDLAPNINFFMNVPVTPEGKLTFEDGISSAGKYVEMRAEMDVVCLISNCPQLNNPCNGYNPTPVRLLVWDATKNK